MSNEIVNKVADSKLIVFDLEDYYTKGCRVQIDISEWLFEGIILKEKEFRENLKNHNWSAYQDNYVAIVCSTDAILPAWASSLVTVYLSNYAKRVVLGSLIDLETTLYIESLQNIDFSIYENKSVILKGCSKKPVPESAYVLAIQNLQKVAKSIMFGEACSAVPLYKQAK